MADRRQELLQEIAEQRATLARLEKELREEIESEGSGAPSAKEWPPRGFYLTYYVVAGLMLGVLGSLTSFLVNVLGSLLVEQDPLLFLRVYGTVFLGPDALTTSDLNFFMLVAVVHFSVGAIGGAVYHVFVNAFWPDRTDVQIAVGAGYGLLMWAVNFYVVILWLQTSVFGHAYVLDLMPVWVAILTHVVYGLTLGVLQPLGRFVPYRPAEAA